MIFDPYENRSSRDIRNRLGEALVESVRTFSTTPFNQCKKDCIAGCGEDEAFAYVQHRSSRFDVLFSLLEDPGSGEANRADRVPVLMWELGLFFEFHEWVEDLWTASVGKEKKALQALILAAVAGEHLTYCRQAPACRLASRALTLLDSCGHCLPPWADLDLFTGFLTDLISHPSRIHQAITASRSTP